MPWIVGGDFNTIAHPYEKSGHHQADVRSILDFNNFLMSAGLSDAGFNGTKYTWINNRKGDDNIIERLDRFLINGEFIARYDLPKVTHLTSTASGHSPIL